MPQLRFVWSWAFRRTYVLFCFVLFGFVLFCFVFFVCLFLFFCFSFFLFFCFFFVFLVFLVWGPGLGSWLWASLPGPRLWGSGPGTKKTQKTKKLKKQKSKETKKLDCLVSLFVFCFLFFCFFWFGTWPGASEPWAGEGGPEPAPQPWPRALRLWARCQHPNQKPAPSSAQGSEALGQVLAPKPKISVYGIAWLSIASYSVVWYDII